MWTPPSEMPQPPTRSGSISLGAQPGQGVADVLLLVVWVEVVSWLAFAGSEPAIRRTPGGGPDGTIALRSRAG